ncbi:MAG TPA: MarR family transcriptional regulator, partial [Candidatus Faecousia intestinavium]|nr:MarR family transcriptional regulator [Candidatus Faecousia intestinavium]
MQIHYGHLARLLHCSIDQALTNAVESMELTAAQGRVVAFVIHAQEPPCPRDIEQAFHLSHPTVSGLLSRLEQKGFLESRTDPQDRRCRRIYILPKGVETFDRMHQAIGEI